MRKLSIVLFSTALLAVGTAWAGPIQYTFTLSTASINGTGGSIDFALYPGAGSDQPLTATVFAFSPAMSPYTGVQTLTGSAMGGPVVGGKSLLLGSGNQVNDDLETLTFSNLLTFTVSITGPAVTAPDGKATSPYQFVFSTYSNAGGTVPVLTSDPGGASGIVNISGQGVVSTSAVSPQLGVAATPEPATFWMLAGAAMALVGYRRRPRRTNLAASR